MIISNCNQRMKQDFSSPYGLILAGMQSSSGKTAVTCMLLAALQKRQIHIQPFKVGPDFIDPGYHTFYSDSVSRNLDVWMMGENGIREEVNRVGAGKISMVEGVMGLFDGSDVKSDEGSTMALARLLNWPIILVVPSAKAGRSLSAALRGFIAEAGADQIVGVILNQVSGNSHTEYLREAIAPLKIPILGAIPHQDTLHWPERHLGLQASIEMNLPSRDVFAQLGEKFLDINRILSFVSAAPVKNIFKKEMDAPKCRLALARDEAFHFYYESNLDYLKDRGAELIPFSPIHDRALPSQIDGIILGGGFPEIFAEKLADNSSMRKSLSNAIEAGLPCYAECGGLMLLSEGLIGLDKKRYPMMGIVPGTIEMTSRLNHFGYCTCKTESGMMFRGHEFHYSHWREESAQANLWTVTRKRTGLSRTEGYQRKKLRASYTHLYWSNCSIIFEKLFKF